MITNKKFLLLSLLMAPALKAECCQDNMTCAAETTCTKTESTECRECPETKTTDTAGDTDRKTCESETTKTAETANTCCDTSCNMESKVNCKDCAKSCPENWGTTCKSICSDECKEENSENNDNKELTRESCNSCCCQTEEEQENIEVVKYYDINNCDNTQEEQEKRVIATAILEAEKSIAHIFKIFGELSNAYHGMSLDQKTVFAKTLVNFFVNIQKEIKSHAELFEKIGHEYIKACENLKFEFVTDTTKSEEENLKTNFTIFVSKSAQFYVDFGYVYKNLTQTEQDELAQIFADVYLQQKKLCQESSVVLNEIIQALGKAITVAR